MQEFLNVLITVNFSDAIMDRLKTISPRIKFMRKPVKSAADIPPETWKIVDILYTGRILPDPQSAPRLRWVQCHLAGVDSILSHPLFASEEILLTTTSGIHASTMAEYTLTMMFAFARKLPLMLRLQSSSQWPENRHELLLPRQLRGSTLGIVGYGSIGRATARLANAVGMDVLATKRNVKHPEEHLSYQLDEVGDPEAEYVHRLYPPEALKSMLAECDFVQVAVPSIPSNRGLIAMEEFDVMQRTAVIINVARGEVIDEADLIDALQSGKIGGAALDVFEVEPLPITSPLWGMENVIISPHISGNSEDYNEKAAGVLEANLRRYLDDEELVNRVDWKRGY